MPSYKTHSIHGDLVLPYINSRIELDENDLRWFSIGPDLIMPTNYKLANIQHTSRVKAYFEHLIKYIKKNELYTDSKTMAFLYGALDHFVVDSTIHPLIIYMSEGIKKDHLLRPHTLFEFELDNYVMNEYGNSSYKNEELLNDKLKTTIDEVYKDIFNKNNFSNRYEYGKNVVYLYDKLRSTNKEFIKKITNMINLGDIYYSEDYSDIYKYLNIVNDMIRNPFSGAITHDSFDQLWNKSITMSLELINAVNRYIYLDEELHNYFIENDISYVTGCPCSKGTNLRYIKKY